MNIILAASLALLAVGCATVKDDRLIDDGFGYKFKLMNSPKVAVIVDDEANDSSEMKSSAMLMSRLVRMPPVVEYHVQKAILDIDNRGMLICKVQSEGSIFYFSYSFESHEWRFDGRHILSGL